MPRAKRRKRVRVEMTVREKMLNSAFSPPPRWSKRACSWTRPRQGIAIWQRGKGKTLLLDLTFGTRSHRDTYAVPNCDATPLRVHATICITLLSSSKVCKVSHPACCPSQLNHTPFLFPHFLLIITFLTSRFATPPTAANQNFCTSLGPHWRGALVLLSYSPSFHPNLSP